MFADADIAHDRFQKAWSRLSQNVVYYFEEQDIVHPERITNAARATTVNTQGHTEKAQITVIPTETNSGAGVSERVLGLTQCTCEWPAVLTFLPKSQFRPWT